MAVGLVHSEAPKTGDTPAELAAADAVGVAAADTVAVAAASVGDGAAEVATLPPHEATKSTGKMSPMIRFFTCRP